MGFLFSVGFPVVFAPHTPHPHTHTPSCLFACQYCPHLIVSPQGGDLVVSPPRGDTFSHRALMSGSGYFGFLTCSSIKSCDKIATSVSVCVRVGGCQKKKTRWPSHYKRWQNQGHVKKIKNVKAYRCSKFDALQMKRTRLVKPYKRLQSQGQGYVNNSLPLYRGLLFSFKFAKVDYDSTANQQTKKEITVCVFSHVCGWID